MKFLSLFFLAISLNGFAQENLEIFKLDCQFEKTVQTADGNWERVIVDQTVLRVKDDNKKVEAQVEAQFMGDNYLITGIAKIWKEENDENNRTMSLKVTLNNLTKNYIIHNIDNLMQPLPTWKGMLARSNMIFQDKVKNETVAMGCYLLKETY
jgi:hypothetical protein